LPAAKTLLSLQTEMRTILKYVSPDRLARTLDRLAPGEEAVLEAVDGEPGLRRRLMELGLLPGTPVRLVRRLEAGGVLELEVRRARLSLRTLDARCLAVRATG
jgi:ferrous iron transport protein A